MITYPARITVKSYVGRNPSKLFQYQEKLRFSSEIEAYLNSAAQSLNNGESISIEYSEIASALGIPKDTIKEVLKAIDYGSNGVTICKPSPESNQSR